MGGGSKSDSVFFDHRPFKHSRSPRGPSSAGIAAPFESGSFLHSAIPAELLRMWRQSGGRLRQFGQKSRLSRRMAFIGVRAFWKQLDLGPSDPDAERRNVTL